MTIIPKTGLSPDWTARIKRTVFYRALVVNTVIAIVLSALVALTILHDLYEPYPISLHTASIATQRILVLSAIAVLVRSTLAPFFLGECLLRIKYHFRDSEIIIRRLPRGLMGAGGHDEHDLQSLCTNAARSVDPALLYSNLRSFFSRDYWTMEYGAVMDAYSSISVGEFTEEDFEFSILKRDDSGHWNVYELWRIHGVATEKQERV
ncbi:hypothetical protein CC1G_00915 [Coprinopsis cinerea okayama7|uniref:Uncharacterized protein n=1 Tax=Coprinopsis cinerea (strain Okayama-7 / 130 / ATCC MYA-4618 / FGSC 9003) TaxID=240176 RepID=A8N940_COPC7|nr:hypothetical protein CC1G_00915 [Coprinopsis cinerea okayama7\|eukprot:XP_001831368.2 hypothetical protein CC1G_00915 [Coprinopsis cinerea okayama7\